MGAVRQNTLTSPHLSLLCSPPICSETIIMLHTKMISALLLLSTGGVICDGPGHFAVFHHGSHHPTAAPPSPGPAPVAPPAPVGVAPVGVAPVGVAPYQAAAPAPAPECVTHTEEQCHTTYEQVCDDQPQVCVDVTEQECVTENQEICVRVQDTSCDTTYQDVCIDTVETQCSQVTETIIETRCQETPER